MVVEERAHLGSLNAVDDARHEDVAHVVANLLQHLAVGFRLVAVNGEDELIVLRGDDNGIYAYGATVIVVLDGHLALGIRAQVGHLQSLAADVGEDAQDAVAQVEGQRQIVLGLVGGIAEHHALVAGALTHGILALYAAVDVGALLMDGGEDAAGVGLEHIFALGVADAADGVAGNLGEIHVSLGLHLAGQNDLPCGDECLTGNLGLRVESQQVIKDCITNLVGNLVGVPFTNRFRGK